MLRFKQFFILILYFYFSIVVLTACGDSKSSNGVNGAPGSDIITNTDENNDRDGDGLTNNEEIELWETNPDDYDTDGDGYSDGDEVNKYAFDPENNRYRFNPLVADIPQFSFQLASLPVIGINYKEGSSSSEGKTIRSAYTDTKSVTTTRGNENTISLESGIAMTVGAEASVGIDTSASLSVEVSSHFNFGYAQCFSWSNSQSRENSETYEEAKSYEDSNSYEMDGGSLMITAQIINEGNIDFTLDNFILDVREFTSSTPGQAVPVAKLDAGQGGDVFPNTTITNGDQIMVNFETNLDLDTAKRLLKESRNLVFSPSTYQLRDAQGNAIGHSMTEIKSKAAVISIDYGYGQVPEKYYLAIRLADGKNGISLEKALSILDLDYSTDPVTWTLKNPHGTTERTTTFDGLTAVRGVSSNESKNKYWVILRTKDDGVKETAYLYSSNLQDYKLADIELNAGDRIEIKLIKDEDKDLLSVREEVLNNSKDTETDSDKDGITDYNEVKVGWYAYGSRVYSNPGREDSDDDGLMDSVERRFCDENAIQADDCPVNHLNDELQVIFNDKGQIPVPFDPEDNDRMNDISMVSGDPTHPGAIDTDGDEINDFFDVRPAEFDQVESLDEFSSSAIDESSIRLQWQDQTIMTDTSDFYLGLIIVRHIDNKNINLPENSIEFQQGDTIGDSTVIYNKEHGLCDSTFYTDESGLTEGRTYYYTAQVYSINKNNNSLQYYPAKNTEGKTELKVHINEVNGIYPDPDNAPHNHAIKLSWNKPVTTSYKGLIIIRSEEGILNASFPIKNPETPGQYKNWFDDDDSRLTNPDHDLDGDIRIIYVGNGINYTDEEVHYSSSYDYGFFAYTDEDDASSYQNGIIKTGKTWTQLKAEFSELETNNIGDGAGSKCELYWRFKWQDLSRTIPYTYFVPNYPHEPEERHGFMHPGGVFAEKKCNNAKEFPEDSDRLIPTGDQARTFYVDTDLSPKIKVKMYMRENDGGCDHVEDIKGNDSGDDDSFGKSKDTHFSKTIPWDTIAQGDAAYEDDKLYYIEKDKEKKDRWIRLKYKIEIVTPQGM